MVRINENLIINESHIVKAELSKIDDDQILTLFFAIQSADLNQTLYKVVLRGSEAWSLWEYLVAKAERC